MVKTIVDDKTNRTFVFYWQPIALNTKPKFLKAETVAHTKGGRTKLVVYPKLSFNLKNRFKKLPYPKREDYEFYGY
jgi:hypothetical protein